MDEVSPPKSLYSGSFPPPPPQPNLLVIIPLWIIAGLGVIATMYLARSVLVPIAVSLMLAAVLQPMVRLLRLRLHMGAGAAAMTTMIVVVAIQVFAGIWTVAGVQYITDRDTIAKLGTQINTSVQQHEWLAAILPAPEKLGELLSGSEFRERAGNAVEVIGYIVAQWVLVMFLTFFYLAEGEWLLEKLALVVGQTSDGRRRAVDTFERIGHQFVRFMVVRTLINLGLTLVLAAVLFTMQVEYWQAWAVLAFVMTYVPYLGPVVAAAPPCLLVLLNPEHGGLGPMAVLVCIYCLLFVIEGYIAVPMLMGKSLDLNATTVMVACLFWLFVWGEIGLVLAIPFTAAIKLSLEEIRGMRYWADLMSSGHGVSR